MVIKLSLEYLKPQTPPTHLSSLLLLLGDLNAFIIFFFILFTTFLVSTNSALHLLLTAELLWITLYAIALTVGVVYNCLNFLSLTFFFLVFSATEFGIGLILILLQQIITRSLNLHVRDSNFFQFMNRYGRFLNVTRIKF